MLKIKLTRRVVLSSLVATSLAGMAACAGSSRVSALDTDRSDPVVYLVRHAEKELGRDPNLTAAGQARAEALAEHLAGQKIDVIYSTNFRRTRQTAAPIALRRSMPVIFYDPSDLAGLAEKLKSDGRSALVVGHSNTTPQLSAALGGEAGPPIVEATEYDRLYKVGLGETVRTEILRFGAISETAP